MNVSRNAYGCESELSGLADSVDVKSNRFSIDVIQDRVSGGSPRRDRRGIQFRVLRPSHHFPRKPSESLVSVGVATYKDAAIGNG